MDFLDLFGFLKNGDIINEHKTITWFRSGISADPIIIVLIYRSALCQASNNDFINLHDISRYF